MAKTKNAAETRVTSVAWHCGWHRGAMPLYSTAADRAGAVVVWLVRWMQWLSAIDQGAGPPPDPSARCMMLRVA